jgi:hypothetical protein
MAEESTATSQSPQSVLWQQQYLGDLCPESLATSQQPGSFNYDWESGQYPISNLWPETVEHMGIKQDPNHKCLLEEQGNTEHVAQGKRYFQVLCDTQT